MARPHPDHEHDDFAARSADRIAERPPGPSRQPFRPLSLENDQSETPRAASVSIEETSSLTSPLDEAQSQLSAAASSKDSSAAEHEGVSSPFGSAGSVMSGGEDSASGEGESPVGDGHDTRLYSGDEIIGAEHYAKPDEEEDDADTGGLRGAKDPSKQRQTRIIRTRRTWRHQAVRIGALYLVPAILAILLSLIIFLTRLILEPLYNTLPLSLHQIQLYVLCSVPLAIIFWRANRRSRLREAISGGVCFCISAIAGDVVAIAGRRVGSLTGRHLGPEWGAWSARATLGVGVMGGGAGFALLCSDYIYSLRPVRTPRDNVENFIFVAFGVTAFSGHVWLGERAWDKILAGGTSVLVRYPEKTILSLSLLLTALSLFIRPCAPTSSFARSLHSLLETKLKLEPSTSSQLWAILSRLPRQAFPLLLAVRLPLLILALRQQLFLRPNPPYLAANDTLRVLHSERSVTGQIVVAENLQAGYRFLRCDASILGGRWIRTVSDGKGGRRSDLGDSIFATFPLQEVALLANRADEMDSLASTIALTTGLQVSPETNATAEAEDPSERALIIGLGVGIAASAFLRHNVSVDIVEIDPLVLSAATDYFGLAISPDSTANVVDGATYVHSLAQLQRAGEYGGQKWRFVVQDCFSGGMVPAQLFTVEFWEDLLELVEDDGVIAMNFVGPKHSLASRAVLVTILPVFTQCRAFGDGLEAGRGEDEAINVVVFCTMAESHLLTFRRPTAADVLRSPLRSHVYSTFLSHEIQLDTIVHESDREKDELLLRDGENRLDAWQVPTALGTWRSMQKILTPEMWLAY